MVNPRLQNPTFDPVGPAQEIKEHGTFSSGGTHVPLILTRDDEDVRGSVPNNFELLQAASQRPEDNGKPASQPSLIKKDKAKKTDAKKSELKTQKDDGRATGPGTNRDFSDEEEANQTSTLNIVKGKEDKTQKAEKGLGSEFYFIFFDENYRY